MFAKNTLTNPDHSHRFCLFGINVGLTEKFESNSVANRIHISEKTQELLSDKYKVEPRNDEGLSMKVGRGGVAEILPLSLSSSPGS